MLLVRSFMEKRKDFFLPCRPKYCPCFSDAWPCLQIVIVLEWVTLYLDEMRTNNFFFIRTAANCLLISALSGLSWLNEWLAGSEPRKKVGFLFGQQIQGRQLELKIEEGRGRMRGRKRKTCFLPAKKKVAILFLSELSFPALHCPVPGQKMQCQNR